MFGKIIKSILHWITDKVAEQCFITTFFPSAIIGYGGSYFAKSNLNMNSFYLYIIFLIFFFIAFFLFYRISRNKTSQQTLPQEFPETCINFQILTRKIGSEDQINILVNKTDSTNFRKRQLCSIDTKKNSNDKDCYKICILFILEYLIKLSPNHKISIFEKNDNDGENFLCNLESNILIDSINEKNGFYDSFIIQIFVPISMFEKLNDRKTKVRLTL